MFDEPVRPAAAPSGEALQIFGHACMGSSCLAWQNNAQQMYDSAQNGCWILGFQL